MPTILIISPEPWSHIFVSKHHYAYLLSEKGYDVYFMEPPTRRKDIALHKINSQLTSISYPLIRGIHRLPSILKRVIQKKIARIIIARIKKQPDIVWSFDPYPFQDLSVFSDNAVKIYHPVDMHHTKLEMEIAEKSDLILSTAHLILDKFKRLNVPAYQINHGLASHFLKDVVSKFNIPKGNGSIRVGYMGNLNYLHIDYQDIHTIVSSNLDVDFYFIGPHKAGNLGNDVPFKKDIQRLESYPNTFLLGSQKSNDLPSMLSQMDMFLMAYKSEGNETQMANPHKILEFLSTGKVTVCHYIDQYKDKQELLEMVTSNEDLPAAFDKVRHHLNEYNSKHRMTIRKNFAKDNSYDKQLDRIFDLINKHCNHDERSIKFNIYEGR